jgi:hypothetical protein
MQFVALSSEYCIHMKGWNTNAHILYNTDQMLQVRFHTSLKLS